MLGLELIITLDSQLLDLGLALRTFLPTHLWTLVASYMEILGREEVCHLGKDVLQKLFGTGLSMAFMTSFVQFGTLALQTSINTFGTNIIVDFDRRADDKTNANILILGNSGQGKSYLMKPTRMSGICKARCSRNG